jgi:hypothetical protein
MHRVFIGIIAVIMHHHLNITKALDSPYGVESPSVIGALG